MFGNSGEYKPRFNVSVRRLNPNDMYPPDSKEIPVLRSTPLQKNTEFMPRMTATVRKIYGPEKQPPVEEINFESQPIEVARMEEPLRYEGPREIPPDEEVYIPPPVEDDIPRILREWDDRYGRYRDIDYIYDPQGWKNEYSQDDPFFNYNPGNVNRTDKKIKLNDEEIYDGDLNSNNQKHGFGTQITPSGLKQGYWQNDQFTGWNCEAQRGNNVVRTGRFENGIMEGKGEWDNTVTNFKGEFKDDYKYYGTETNPKSKYLGYFEDNKRHGKGKIQYDTENKGKFDYEYEGDFERGNSTGQGKINWANGNEYEGEVLKGKMDGRGICRYSNGRIYDGEFKNGQKHGKGRYTLQDGRVFEGTFVNGREDGQGTTTFPDGHTFTGIYKNGTLQGEA